MKYILIIFFLYSTSVDSWGVPALENGKPILHSSEIVCEQAAQLLKTRLDNEFREMAKPTIVLICPPEKEWYKFDRKEGYAYG